MILEHARARGHRFLRCNDQFLSVVHFPSTRSCGGSRDRAAPWRPGAPRCAGGCTRGSPPPYSPMGRPSRANFPGPRRTSATAARGASPPDGSSGCVRARCGCSDRRSPRPCGGCPECGTDSARCSPRGRFLRSSRSTVKHAELDEVVSAAAGPELRDHARSPSWLRDGVTLQSRSMTGCSRRSGRAPLMPNRGLGLDRLASRLSAPRSSFFSGRSSTVIFTRHAMSTPTAYGITASASRARRRSGRPATDVRVGHEARAARTAANGRHACHLVDLTFRKIGRAHCFTGRPNDEVKSWLVASQGRAIRPGCATRGASSSSARIARRPASITWRSRRIAARGHTPVIATHPYYRARVEGAGLGFAPGAPDMSEYGDPAEVMREDDGPPRQPLDPSNTSCSPKLTGARDDLAACERPLVVSTCSRSTTLVVDEARRAARALRAAALTMYSCADPAGSAGMPLHDQAMRWGPGVWRVLYAIMRASSAPWFRRRSRACGARWGLPPAAAHLMLGLSHRRADAARCFSRCSPKSRSWSWPSAAPSRASACTTDATRGRRHERRAARVRSSPQAEPPGRLRSARRRCSTREFWDVTRPASRARSAMRAVLQLTGGDGGKRPTSNDGDRVLAVPYAARLFGRVGHGALRRRGHDRTSARLGPPDGHAGPGTTSPATPGASRGRRGARRAAATTGVRIACARAGRPARGRRTPLAQAANRRDRPRSKPRGAAAADALAVLVAAATLTSAGRELPARRLVSRSGRALNLGRSTTLRSTG